MMNALTKRSLICAALLSVGLPFSSSVYRPASALSTAVPTETILAAAASTKLSEESIEDRLQGTGELSREYRFTGTANEIVVVYWDLDNGSYYSEPLKLYDAAGNAIDINYDYPEDMFWEEPDGRHAYFRLPATGEYKLVFSSGITLPEEDFDFLLRARVASYYERLMIAAETLPHEESLPLLTLAIEQEPDSPAPYFQRLMRQADVLLESEAFVAQFDRFSDVDLDEDPDSFYEIAYEIFKTLDEDTQALIIGDLKQIGRTYALAVENGRTEVDEFPLGMFTGIAEFLETGEPNDAVRLLVSEEPSEPVEEPIVAPPSPVEPAAPLPSEPVSPSSTDMISPE